MKPGPQRLAKFAEEQAADRLKTFRANLRKAAKHPGRPDPIHDLRVSIRRFTQALRVFKDLWDHGHYRKMRRRLRRVMDLCGAVRNCDIAIEILDAAHAPPAKALRAALQKQRLRAERDLSEELASSTSKATVRGWKDWLSVQDGKDQSLQARARAIVRPLTQEYLKAGERVVQPEISLDELHALRLMAKRLRYSLEIFGGLARADWEQEVERIREVQDLLGAINDCVTTTGLITEYGHSTDVRRLKGHLTQLLSQRLTAFRRHWGKVYHSIHAPQYRDTRGQAGAA